MRRPTYIDENWTYTDVDWSWFEKKKKRNANHFFFIYFLSSNRGPSQGKMTTLKFPEHLKRLKKHYSLMQYKGHNSMRWPFYNHFWPFFCQLHKYLSQNLGADSHFEGLNVSKSQWDQNLWHKTQFFLTSVFSNFVKDTVVGKKWLEMVVKWPTHTVVTFILHHTIEDNAQLWL